MSGLERLKEALIGLLYPRRAVCLGCDSRAGNERDWLCEDCRQRLAASWVGPTPRFRGEFDGAAFAYRYAGPAGGLVRAVKYNGVTRAAEPMAKDLARACEGLRPLRADWVVPVPMHPRRLRQRGFNHAAVLAERLAGILEIPMVEALQRVIDTPQQALLEENERRRSMKGAFTASPEVKDRCVLLVDDVYTTGATAMACAKALRKAGARNVYLACYAVAKPPRKG